ncbi:MAG: hypothetical protein GF308_02460 [Candidatus Heimdallarchaeota archaeon]|nr:hypothetical protein [Candidatus Heimdallarchaeota archaeon]
MSIELDDAFIEKLLEKLRENKEFARKLHYLLEDEFVRKVEIKEMLAELRKMREESEKRWKELMKEFRERTKTVDQRFEQMDKKVDRGFAELSLGFGINFEDLSQVIVKKIMAIQGIKLPKLERKSFVDHKMTVHKDSTDVEVDLFSEEPLIIGEVTGSIIERDKIERFIRKIQFLEEKFKKKATLKIVVTYRIHSSLSKEIREMLKKEGIELIAIDD